MFIEERLEEISLELNQKEEELTKFREKYRNESAAEWNSFKYIQAKEARKLIVALNQ